MDRQIGGKLQTSDVGGWTEMTSFSGIVRRIALLSVAGLASLTTGCVSLSYSSANLSAVPAHQVPKEILGRPKSEMQQISISRLRQQPPKVYQLGAGDVLGIYIENVLGVEGESPPVHFPETGNQPPALGFPVPINEDGTIALPYITPIPIAGKSLSDATAAIKHAYSTMDIIKAGKENIIVTLIRRRQYRVQVIREEAGGKEGVSKRGTGQSVDLNAYENDLLHALNETGGLPGSDARNEIYIIRGSFEDGARRDQIVAQILASKPECECPCPLPDDPSVVRVPIRFYPDELPEFTEQDIILEAGDVVFIPGRDAEKFYTGGAIQGGEWTIPRDYDLDVLNAVAFARGQIGSGGTGLIRVGGAQSGIGGGGGGSGGPIGKNPSDLIVVRKLPCGGQLPIKVDLNRALQDPTHRILVQPGDTLILRYKVYEEAINAALGLIQFNFLFSGLSGQGA
ncbi:MAG: polysaccharide biosynthesis/export family protein [Planctomycetaceae bacterium]|nr:polysaccharide biosynthesis/export family protein [Planctomycetaceae bacterium]